MSHGMTLNINLYVLDPDRANKVYGSGIQVSRDGLASKNRFWSTQYLFAIYDHVSKSDFGPLGRIFGFGPISIRSKNLDQNWKFERLKCGPKSDWDT